MTISSPSGHLWVTAHHRRGVVPGKGPGHGAPTLGWVKWARRLLLKPPKMERSWVWIGLERVKAQVCHLSGLSN